MVMPFYEGITLKDELKAMGAPPDEEWLRELLEPLTEALAVIHTEQCFHRDIAPDNVILLKGSQRPLLLDFGAARRVIGDMTQALTVILKPGYAPVEQYAEVPGMKQGPWTDVYALAAVVYYAITGKTPPTSVGRLMNDNYVPMTQVGAGRYSPAFLAAIDRALIVKPEERTQSIDDLRADLGMAPSDIDSGKAGRAAGRRPWPAAFRPARRLARKSRAGLFAGIGAVLLLVVAGGLYFAFSGKPAAPATAATDHRRRSRRRRRRVPPTVAPASSAPPVAATADPGRALGHGGLAAGGRAVRPGPRVRARRRGAVGRLQGRGRGRQAAAAHRQGQHDLQGEDREGRLRLRPAVRHRRRHRPGLSQHRRQEQPAQGRQHDFAAAGKGTALTIAGGPPGHRPSAGDRLEPSRATFQGARAEERDGFEQTTARRGAARRPRRQGSGASVFAGTPVCPQPCTDDYGAAVFTVEEIK